MPQNVENEGWVFFLSSSILTSEGRVEYGGVSVRGSHSHAFLPDSMREFPSQLGLESVKDIHCRQYASNPTVGDGFTILEHPHLHSL